MLLVTVAFFMLGYFPYPFGIMVLAVAILARLSVLSALKKRTKR
jgi:hypothetical protein